MFQRLRLREIRRAAYEAGQWAGRGGELRDDPSQTERIRWAFDPKTALLLSVGIILITFWLMWDASATSPNPQGESSMGVTNGATLDEDGNEQADASRAASKRFHSTGQQNPRGGKLRRNSAMEMENEPDTEQSQDRRAEDENTSSKRRITVHVAGAVNRPGVVQLSQGARVYEAIEGAGGITSEGVSDAINLAALIADGQYVYIPSREQIDRGAGVPNEQGSGTQGVGGGSAGAISSGGPGAGGIQARAFGGSGCVNLNSSSAQELQALPGIGPALSQRIVEYRDEHGPFARVEDLDSVSGVGITMVNKIRSGICQIP